MGTDIHMFVEVRNADGHWELAKGEIDNPYYDPKKEPSVWNSPKDPIATSIYGERDYDLFAMLAGVQNSTILVDGKLQTMFVPLSRPRGLPSDVSDAVKQDLVIENTFSHSWLLLEELLNEDYWNQTCVEIGFVSEYWYPTSRKQETLVVSPLQLM